MSPEEPWSRPLSRREDQQKGDVNEESVSEAASSIAPLCINHLYGGDTLFVTVILSFPSWHPCEAQKPIPARCVSGQHHPSHHARIFLHGFDQSLSMRKIEVKCSQLYQLTIRMPAECFPTLS